MGINWLWKDLWITACHSFEHNTSNFRSPWMWNDRSGDLCLFMCEWVCMLGVWHPPKSLIYCLSVLSSGPLDTHTHPHKHTYPYFFPVGPHACPPTWFNPMRKHRRGSESPHYSKKPMDRVNNICMVGGVHEWKLLRKLLQSLQDIPFHINKKYILEYKSSMFVLFQTHSE